jgi:hypothetical protein
MAWSIFMANTTSAVPTGPVTEEGFLADRMRFWAAVTKFMTYVAVGLVMLMLLLWYFLV